ncbi:hypothetical protein BDN67DRAFT_961593 [Paxillus ammoniavirescens]|nr:hypothetical protein BDN67DRAFT_961593 [Paxillus ammoniavirescens]
MLECFGLLCPTPMLVVRLVLLWHTLSCDRNLTMLASKRSVLIHADSAEYISSRCLIAHHLQLAVADGRTVSLHHFKWFENFGRRAWCVHSSQGMYR